MRRKRGVFKSVAGALIVCAPMVCAQEPSAMTELPPAPVKIRPAVSSSGVVPPAQAPKVVVHEHGYISSSVRPDATTPLKAKDYLELSGVGRLPDAEIANDPRLNPSDPTQSFLQWQRRSSDTREWTFRRLNAGVDKVDSWFVGKGVTNYIGGDSRFRAKGSLLFQRDTPVVEPAGEFSATLDMPNLKHRVELYLDYFDPTSLPGTTPEEQKKSAILGLRHYWDVFREKDILSLNAGVKLRWPPALFGEARLEKTYKLGAWDFTPSQRFYWFSDDGFGETTSFYFERMLNHNWAFSSVTSGQWGESTDGFEVGQTLRMAYIADNRRFGWLYRISIFPNFHNDGVTLRDLVLDVTCRMLIYQHWLFLEIGPQINFPDDMDNRINPGLRVGLDILLDGQTLKSFSKP